MSIIQLQADFNTATTVEQLTEVMVNIAGDVINNNHPTSIIVPGVTVMELRGVTGFYQDTRIVQEMLAMYVGRLMKGLLEQHNLKTSDPSIVNQMMQIVMSSQENESKALSHIMDECQIKYGTHQLNRKLVDKIIKKISSTLNQLYS